MPTPRAAKPTDCPQLESRLYELMVAADPARAAADLGLTYEDGRVRVIVELADAATPIPQHPDLVVEGRFSNLVQGRVPPATLCALSRLPDVRFVRAPAVAVPGAAAQPARP